MLTVGSILLRHYKQWNYRS